MSNWFKSASELPTCATSASAVPVATLLATRPVTVTVATTSGASVSRRQITPFSQLPCVAVAATKLTPLGNASTSATFVAVVAPLFVTTSV